MPLRHPFIDLLTKKNDLLNTNQLLLRIFLSCSYSFLKQKANPLFYFSVFKMMSIKWVHRIRHSFRLEGTSWGFKSSLLLRGGSILNVNQIALGFVHSGLGDPPRWRLYYILIVVSFSHLHPVGLSPDSIIDSCSPTMHENIGQS